MSFARYLARRTLFAVFAAYLVVSITFGFVALTADPQRAVVAWGAAHGPPGEFLNQSEANARVNEAVAAYDRARSLDEPVEERYVAWLVDIATLDWGESLDTGEPVAAMLGRTIPRTAAYVLPALLFSLVGGLAVGTCAAMRRNTPADYLATGVGYLGLSLPNFLVGEVLLLLVVIVHDAEGVYRAGPLLPPFVRTVVLPAAVLGAGLFAAQMRYARAESLEYFGEEFVTLLRAKGAGRWRVARHVVRNASLPLLSLFFAELMAVLVVNIYVLEAVFGIRGLGWLSLRAIENRDLPVVLGTTMVVVLVGVAGNLLQDVAAVFLDPRVADDEG